MEAAFALWISRLLSLKPLALAFGRQAKKSG
jgi:hypothetical protein